MTMKLEEFTNLEEAIRAVSEDDAEVIIERDGQPVAVLLSPVYAHILREFEDELEDRLAEQALKEAEEYNATCGEPPMCYDEFRKQLGLE